MLDVGELYMWGREEGDGRLGLGPGRGPDHAGGLSIPCKVKELPFPVAAVSCGGFFTMALTEEGQLWNWGGICQLLYMIYLLYFFLRKYKPFMQCFSFGNFTILVFYQQILTMNLGEVIKLVVGNQDQFPVLRRFE